MHLERWDLGIKPALPGLSCPRPQGLRISSVPGAPHSPWLRSPRSLLSSLATGWPHDSPDLSQRNQPVQQIQRRLWAGVGGESVTQRGIQSGQLLNQLLQAGTGPRRLGTRLASAPSQGLIISRPLGVIAWWSQSIPWERLEGVALCSCREVSHQQPNAVRGWDTTIRSRSGAIACGPGDAHTAVYPLPASICPCSLWALMEGVLWGDGSPVRPLAQASSTRQVRGMDTGSGRDTEVEKALAGDQGSSPNRLGSQAPAQGGLPAPPVFCSYVGEVCVSLCLEAKENSPGWEPWVCTGVWR